MLGWAVSRCIGPKCAVLGPSVLNKGVETNLIVTHFGLACAQTMPRLPGTSFICPWQAELFRMSYGKQTR